MVHADSSLPHWSKLVRPKGWAHKTYISSLRDRWQLRCLWNTRWTHSLHKCGKSVSIIEQYNSLLPFHHAQLQHLFARRWEFWATEQLLDSLKICFVALYGITNKISYKVYKKNGWNPIDSLKKVVFWQMINTNIFYMSTFNFESDYSCYTSEIVNCYSGQDCVMPSS